LNISSVLFDFQLAGPHGQTLLLSGLLAVQPSWLVLLFFVVGGPWNLEGAPYGSFAATQRKLPLSPDPLS